MTAHFLLVAASPIFDFLGLTLEEGDADLLAVDFSLAMVTVVSLFFEFCYLVAIELWLISLRL
jgi:hypothetical protein